MPPLYENEAGSGGGRDEDSNAKGSADERRLCDDQPPSELPRTILTVARDAQHVSSRQLVIPESPHAEPADDGSAGYEQVARSRAELCAEVAAQRVGVWHDHAKRVLTPGPPMSDGGLKLLVIPSGSLTALQGRELAHGWDPKRCRKKSPVGTVTRPHGRMSMLRTSRIRPGENSGATY
jgi:hypothetical protein